MLIDNDGSSDVDGMREMLEGVGRNTWREKFSSAFRSRKQPLDAPVATAVVRTWAQAVERGAERAEAYWEALPYWDPEVVDRDRHGTHQQLLRAARGEEPGAVDEDDEAHENVNDASVPAGASCRPRRQPSSSGNGSSRGC